MSLAELLNLALELMRREHFDVVLCDIAMPGMDGFAVLRCIQEVADTGRPPTPVLAVTAYASDDYRDRCRRAGFQGHIPKPFDTSELIREVGRAVGRS
jgi:CheY-like chemotaxis protein